MPPYIQCEDSSIGRGVCQLYVGHDGEHATLILRNRQRVLRCWLTGAGSVDRPFTAARAASLPWAPGCPRLAPSTLAADLHVVAARPAQPAQPAQPAPIPATSPADTGTDAAQLRLA